MPRLIAYRHGVEVGWEWFTVEDDSGRRRPRRWPVLSLFLLLAGAALAVFMTLRGAGDTAAGAPLSGAIFTTTPDGTIVNENVHYENKKEVYLDGGPPPNAPQTAAGLPNGHYVFQVTDPSGAYLLSEDPAKCRIVRVDDGVIVELVAPSTLGMGLTDTYDPPGPKGPYPCHVQDDPDGAVGQSGRHDTNIDIDHGPPAIVVQLMPFANTPNPGGVYKAWATPIAEYLSKGGDLGKIPHELKVKGKFAGFVPDPGFGPPRDAVKTDNFKAKDVPSPMLHVRKVNDRNDNGVIDPAEPYIDGWLVCITDPTGVENCYGTPADVVADPSGAYQVEESLQSGWVQTCAVLDGTGLGPINPVTVTMDTSDRTVTFCNFNPAELTACKFYDFDRDQEWSGPQEVGLTGWPMTLTGTTFEGAPVEVPQRTGANGCTTFAGLVEGTYVVCEGSPLEPAWTHTTPVCSLPVELPPGEHRTVTFGNVCLVPFAGGLTMGYWKTHTGLDSPPRDATYDLLPVMLGVSPESGYPEALVDSEAEARDIFDAAESSTDDGVLMLRAQLLAAKLNALAFPGFDLTSFPDGTIVGDVMDDADGILDDVANGIPHDKAEIVGVKDLLDAANNNGHTPILVGPSPVPCERTFY